MVKNSMLLALAFCGLSAVAAGINVNEKTVREELNLLLGKADALLPTTFYFSGEDKKGKDCSVQVSTKWVAEPTDKINMESKIDINIDNNDKVHGVFFVGFDGEGPPEKFMGKPVQTYESSGKKLILKQDDSEKDKWENHWIATLEFSSGHKLESLTSVDGKTSHGDEERKGYCGKLALDLALDAKTSDTMSVLIEGELKPRGEKIEIFNGCEPTSKPNSDGVVKVACGFAIDQENDHQGTADFEVGGDSVVLKKVTLEGHVIFKMKN